MTELMPLSSSIENGAVLPYGSYKRRIKLFESSAFFKALSFTWPSMLMLERDNGKALFFYTPI